MAALARQVAGASSSLSAHCETQSGLNVLMLENAARDARAIGSALRENPHIRLVTHATARSAMLTMDKSGAPPDLAIIELNPSCNSGFAAMIELDAQLTALKSLPHTADIPVVVLTPAASNDTTGTGKARRGIEDVAARLDAIISELAPRTKRS